MCTLDTDRQGVYTGGLVYTPATWPDPGRGNEARMDLTTGWHRGQYRCGTAGCNSPAAVGVQVQLSTAGGRKGRVQVRATSVRLCNECLNGLTGGKVPKSLAACIGQAVIKVRGGE